MFFINIRFSKLELLLHLLKRKGHNLKKSAGSYKCSVSGRGGWVDGAGDVEITCIERSNIIVKTCCKACMPPGGLLDLNPFEQ